MPLDFLSPDRSRVFRFASKVVRLKRSVLRYAHTYMNERSTPSGTRIREALKAPRMVYICATLAASLILLSVLTLAGNSFTDYNDVQQVLAFLTDTLPPELKSSDLAARPEIIP